MMPVQTKLLQNSKPKAQINSGARRSFMCHIRKASPVKPEVDDMGINQRRKRTGKLTEDNPYYTSTGNQANYTHTQKC